MFNSLLALSFCKASKRLKRGQEPVTRTPRTLPRYGGCVMCVDEPPARQTTGQSSPPSLDSPHVIGCNTRIISISALLCPPQHSARVDSEVPFSENAFAIYRKLVLHCQIVFSNLCSEEAHPSGGEEVNIIHNHRHTHTYTQQQLIGSGQEITLHCYFFSKNRVLTWKHEH